MPRQSITFTEPNDEWLKTQLDSKEYTSKSEIINDLIRKARQQQAELDSIRLALIEGENSGISTKTAADIKADVIKKMRENGKLSSQ